ncbi:MAG: KamA family radical SAM protein [bacterium]
MIKSPQFVEYKTLGSGPESQDKTSERDPWDQWEWQLKKRITSVDKLSFAWLTRDQKNLLNQVCQRFPMAITPYYLSLMNPEDPDDPIMKQALPSVYETLSSETSYSDPLNEDANSPVKGLTHRYPDRALFILTNSCAVYCRHCTRKRIWKEGNENTLTRAEIKNALDYILRHDEIRDVLISGGDPLMIPVPLLEYVLREVRSIPHVEIIRIGTRAPVVLPQRIDKPLLEVLERFGPIWLNTQFNHPNEITEQSGQACELLLRRSIPVNNQTVLLRGINDRPEIIKELNQKLLRIKVRPYYLFQCDPVIGTEHFRTSLWKGVEIMEQLRGHTSGLAIPHFVIDLPGGGGKVPVLPEYIISRSNHQITFRNYEGKQFVHREPRSQGL